jgi:NhaC family Na+:H+ antiporter
MSTPTPYKLPSPLVSFLPILLLVGILAVTIHTFGSDALSGASQISLLTTTAFCVFIGMVFYRIPWSHFEEAIARNIKGVGPAIIMLLIIGSLSASWMVSGVVPTLIDYGVQLIHPDYFLVSSCLICVLLSVMTGSSWTTIATIGIALMGIGEAQGFEKAWIAGAIISGAYFGDKISPLSETTVLASSVTGVPLFKHIRYMLITTTPTLCITLLIFLVKGLTHEATSADQVSLFTSAIEAKFHITPWLLIVPVVTAILIARRIPSVITLFLSAAMAIGFALAFQPDLLREIAGEDNLFRGAMLTLAESTSIETDSPMLTELVATRGMAGMTDTVWLILCAMCFGGAMTASGMLESMTSVFVHFIRGRFGLVAANVCTGLFLNLTSADQYLSIILTCNMFGPIYRKQGYESRLLSRTTEDAVTVTSVLIPWNTCGMTQATVLNVPTMVYFPYCFFNLLSPLMSLFIAAIGYKIRRVRQEE